MDSLEKSLEKLGFSDKLARVYVALLKVQEANAHEIAREAGIERTTAYNLLNLLASKGLATKTTTGKRIAYVAEPLAKLEKMVAAQQQLVSELIPELSAVRGKKKARPTVEFYEGLQNVRNVLDDTLNSTDTLRRDFASVEDTIQFLGKRFVQNHIDRRVAKKIHVRSLRKKPTGKETESDWHLKSSNKDLLREVRYLDKSFQFKPTIFVQDGAVTVISSEYEGYALVIKSPEMSEALKALFDIAWDNSEKAVD